MKPASRKDFGENFKWTSDDYLSNGHFAIKKCFCALSDEELKDAVKIEFSVISSLLPIPPIGRYSVAHPTALLSEMFSRKVRKPTIHRAIQKEGDRGSLEVVWINEKYFKICVQSIGAHTLLLGKEQGDPVIFAMGDKDVRAIIMPCMMGTIQNILEIH